MAYTVFLLFGADQVACGQFFSVFLTQVDCMRFESLKFRNILTAAGQWVAVYKMTDYSPLYIKGLKLVRDWRE